MIYCKVNVYEKACCMLTAFNVSSGAQNSAYNKDLMRKGIVGDLHTMCEEVNYSILFVYCYAKIEGRKEKKKK